MDILGRITKLVIQRCEACGRVFPVLYKARFDSSTGVFVSDGYDYVGETCDCKADFAPDEGDPSISEWVDGRSPGPVFQAPSQYYLWDGC